ncbi:MAG: septum formation protein Maf [Formosa sp.]|jgi:septum formation protein|nr:septum formation protein Maf [Formosa sp.]MDB2426771.1 Maf family nucleotide pyrophosphatase [Flavobacteriaceae bacterium]MDC0463327.1 Maf family nucleotide pyrophosphatase [Flavobacteriaceae bacterium]|tara:strand:+ start:463 stop:1044 length:582 start_codon:yes stop_codon:yes gene_type:complete
MLADILKDKRLILASSSPRRQELIKGLGLKVEIRIKPIIEEYPEHLKHFEIPDYLAQLKSMQFEDTLTPKDILITSDTIVWFKNTALGKPTDANDAFQMLRSLSGQTHEVITSVCFKTLAKLKTINSITKVTFKQLSNSEINYYIKNFKVLDKAGSYGIQDWIGQIAVTKIEGSYFNVMGFPMDKIYNTLLTF